MRWIRVVGLAPSSSAAPFAPLIFQRSSVARHLDCQLSQKFRPPIVPRRKGLRRRDGRRNHQGEITFQSLSLCDAGGTLDDIPQLADVSRPAAACRPGPGHAFDFLCVVNHFHLRGPSLLAGPLSVETSGAYLSLEEPGRGRNLATA